jgi:NAD(P)H-nitrite reductase large subunit
VYAAGDGTGVEGSYVAMDEGTLAGIAAAIDMGALDDASARMRAAPARKRLRRRRALAAATARLYRVGPGLYELADPDTIICRCEVVRQSQVEAAVVATDDLNVVKAYTRAGMGPCQGKNCQRHIAAVIARRHGRRLDSVPLATPRMPVRPVAISAIADAAVADPGLFGADAP